MDLSKLHSDNKTLKLTKADKEAFHKKKMELLDEKLKKAGTWDQLVTLLDDLKFPYYCGIKEFTLEG